MMTPAALLESIDSIHEQHFINDWNGRLMFKVPFNGGLTCIGQMLTLGNISTAFSYIIKANREGVDVDEFKSILSTRAKEMVLAIEEATAIPRGNGMNFVQRKAHQNNHQDVEIGPITQSGGYNNVDPSNVVPQCKFLQNCTFCIKFQMATKDLLST
eukprot:5217464-Ditylum_brightwellii.AAC.1